MADHDPGARSSGSPPSRVPVLLVIPSALDRPPGSGPRPAGQGGAPRRTNDLQPRGEIGWPCPGSIAGSGPSGCGITAGQRGVTQAPPRRCRAHHRARVHPGQPQRLAPPLSRPARPRPGAGRGRHRRLHGHIHTRLAASCRALGLRVPDQLHAVRIDPNVSAAAAGAYIAKSAQWTPAEEMTPRRPQDEPCR